MITLANLKIVITNARCYAAELGARISDLYSIGSKCADSELAKLKILEDRIKILEEYYCVQETILYETFPNTTLFSVPLGWEEDIPESWLWDAKKITPSGLVSDSTSGLVSFFPNNGNISIIFKRDLLTKDIRYKVEFDLYYDSDLGQEEPSLIRIGLGSNYINVNSYELVSHITLEGVCEDNGTFTIEGTDNAGLNNQYAIDNIKIYPIKNNCLTYEQIDNIAHYVMKQCDICECQLNQD